MLFGLTLGNRGLRWLLANICLIIFFEPDSMKAMTESQVFTKTQKFKKSQNFSNFN